MKYCLLLLFISLFYCLVPAQTKYRVLSVPAQQYGQTLRMPWTGGMDSPEFSEVDLNNDGIKDLFVFDKVGNKVLTFLSNGDGSDTMYTYAPQYEALFPSDLVEWALLIDYNHDGIPDIFTHSLVSTSSGIRVFKGSMQNGYLHYDLVCPLIQYTDQGFTTGVFSNVNDVPVITDVNRDGYIDILSYNTFGSTIGYYENQTGLNPGNPAFNIDSFQYSLVTSCWGSVAQNLLSNSMTLQQSCKGGPGGGNQPPDPRHSGNSLYSIIDPVYNDVDLLNGNIGYDNLFLLRNCGDSSYANVCEWDSIFPTCNVPMLMATYPAAFGIDVNHDGLQDILLSPNIPGSYVNGGGAGRNTKNVMYYQNTGDTSCWYNYQTDSFLVHHALDFGSNSKALFYDFNGDGLLDIVVGNLGYFLNGPSYSSTLGVYLNTGTATHPVFTRQTVDYNNFSQYNLVSVDPTLGDLNGDVHNDLLIGDSYGYLYYFQNAASTGSSFPSMTSAQYEGIQVGLNAAPFLYPLNNDSLNDIVVGDQTGQLTYFWNFGTRANAQFSQDSSISNFGNVNVTKNGASFGYSRPYIQRASSGGLFLYVGSESGYIYKYLVDSTQLRGGSFTLIDSNFIGQGVGAMSSISIADINNDGYLEYLVGNARGGLLMYSDSDWDPGTVLGVADLPLNQNGMRVFPNPAKGYFVCASENQPFVNPKTEVYNILGEKMNTETIFANNKVTVTTSSLSIGFYMVRIMDEGKTYTAKVIIEQ
jgi:hypothetical protein